MCVLPWDGSALHILGTTGFGANHRVAWSPDGQYLAFVGYLEGQPREDGQYVLWIARATGQEARALNVPLELDEDGMSDPSRPTWSPDGTQIVFADSGFCRSSTCKERLILFPAQKNTSRWGR